MKPIWGRVLLTLLSAALLIALAAAIRMRNSSQQPDPEQAVTQPVTSAPEPSPTQDPQSNILAQARNFGIRKAVLNPGERAALEQKFHTAIKPAVERWCQAYSGHVPFRPEDLTLEKFKEQMGRDASFTIYTFMVDGITVCIRDTKGNAVVNYVSAPQANLLNKIEAHTTPSLEVPIKKDEIIQMVKADSGKEFKPGEVYLKPTGTASAMNGGAFVDVAPLGGDPNNGLCKVSLVFGPNGEILYYSRDPTL